MINRICKYFGQKRLVLVMPCSNEARVFVARKSQSGWWVKWGYAAIILIPDGRAEGFDGTARQWLPLQGWPADEVPK